VLPAENIPLSLGVRAGGGGAQAICRIIGFPPIRPADGDLGTDDLNINWCRHGFSSLSEAQPQTIRRLEAIRNARLTNV
jgi:hypothetical protein